MKKINKQIEPSLLSLDKNETIAIGQIKDLKKAGIEYVHYDVMDDFVHNTSFTTEYLQLLTDIGLKTNVHLMVNKPIDWINLYTPFKTIQGITFHLESQSLSETITLLKAIRSKGFKAGIAVKYQTNLADYKEVLTHCDLITVMSVTPGKGGQPFQEECINNLKTIKKFKEHHPDLIVQLDGGVNLEIMKTYYQYVDYFISGSYIFKNITTLKNIIKEFNSLN